jgi:large subunit ribosomal protein L15
MQLNTLKPAPGAKKNRYRVGRGIGCGNGKTCGRGHKGQTARSGYSHKLGFEGGQMPLQRRVPKFGFSTEMSRETAEVRLGGLMKVKEERIDLEALRKANLIGHTASRAKIFLSGAITKPVTIAKDILITKGARLAIEAAGGKIEE